MCLAVPGKIVTIEGADPAAARGRVDFAGVVKQVNLAYVPDARVGDYVLVHVGFAINTIDEHEAAHVFEYLRQMGELAELRDGRRTGHEVHRRIPRRRRGSRLRARAGANHDAPVDAHGGLRRPDPCDREVRRRRAAARRRHAGPRPGLPGLRHAAGVDREGDRDRVATRA